MQLDNQWQVYGDTIYHAQLAIRYATICQVRPDGSVYRQLLDEEVAKLNAAFAQLKRVSDTASAQDLSHEPQKETA